jgi:hypothetical protein
LDVSLNVDLLSIPVLSIIFPLTYVEEATVNDTAKTMALVILELPFIK